MALKKIPVAKDKTTKKHAQRGTGLKFTSDLYEFIARCTSATRVKYVPNPKTPGSKSFVRYKLYENSKTVREAMKHCKPADLLWEYQRGFLKISGPMADVPACLAPPSKDPVVQTLARFRGPNGNSIKMNPEVRKKLSAKAKEFGLDLDKIHEAAGKQCNSESADVQTGRVVANEMARLKLESGKKVVDKDILQVLDLWGFAENTTRENVLPVGAKFVHSDTLGVLRMRNGTYRVFDPTIRYAYVTKLLNEWFSTNRSRDIPSNFGWTGININFNYAGRRHRDNGNEGPSAIKAIGSFSGGMLDYFPKDVKVSGCKDVARLDPAESIPLDLSQKFVLFNGNNAHGVRQFKGTRYSLVFFTTSKFHKVQKKEVKTLQKLRFKVPNAATMKQVKDISKKMDEARAKVLK